MRSGDATGQPGADEPIVQHCPYCGDLVGSFWGNRDGHGECWCESCMVHFRVEVVDDAPAPA